jgi:hypothetical protein
MDPVLVSAVRDARHLAQIAAELVLPLPLVPLQALGYASDWEALAS